MEPEEDLWLLPPELESVVEDDVADNIVLVLDNEKAADINCEPEVDYALEEDVEGAADSVEVVETAVVEAPRLAFAA